MQSNRFEVSGFIATKPSYRKLPSGTPVANLRLAQTYSYDTKEGREKQTNWFNLTFYGAFANLAMTYEKGDNIHVVGSIQQRQFTPKDGSKRTVHEIVVQTCHRIAAQRETALPATSDVLADNLVENDPAGNQPAIPEDDDAWAIL